MMGGKMPETCWAVNKHQDNELENCCNMFSFGCFPGVWVLIADVSEQSVPSSKAGRWSVTGAGMCGVFIPDRVQAGWWRSRWEGE
jgi:hypothetical protein